MKSEEQGLLIGVLVIVTIAEWEAFWQRYGQHRVQERAEAKVMAEEEAPAMSDQERERRLGFLAYEMQHGKFVVDKPNPGDVLTPLPVFDYKPKEVPIDKRTSAQPL